MAYETALAIAVYSFFFVIAPFSMLWSWRVMQRHFAACDANVRKLEMLLARDFNH